MEQPFAVAVSGHERILAEVFTLVVEKTVAPRPVETSYFFLGRELFEAIAKKRFDLLIVVSSPVWHENTLHNHGAERDRELFRKLHSQSAAALVVVHNGVAKHSEESLRPVGVDLVLQIPFGAEALTDFLSRRFKINR